MPESSRLREGGADKASVPSENGTDPLRFAFSIPACWIRLFGGVPSHLTIAISPGRQVLLNHGSRGPYSRRIMNQPLPGMV